MTTSAYRDQVNATITMLAERFPKTFFVYQVRRKPLKIGIHNDLQVELNGAVTVDHGPTLDPARQRA
jgi:sRNA-binding protein